MSGVLRAPGFSEFASKRQVALIGAIGSIVVALVAGMVSYFVSSATVEVELRRAEMQDSLARAEFFRELVGEVEAGSKYALLALWKIYPEDKQLIVITALQEPNEQTLNTLRDLGLADELKDYEDTIKSLMRNADIEDRIGYRKAFLDLSPGSVLDVAVEAVINSENSTDHFNPAVNELVSVLGYKRGLFEKRLLEHISNSGRIKEDIDLRITFARIAYGFEPKLMAALFDDMKTDIHSFSTLAAKFDSGDIEALDVSDREHLFSLTIEFLRKTLKGKPKEYYFNDGMDLVNRLQKKIVVTSDQKDELAALISQVYRSHARNGTPPGTLLRDHLLYAPNQTGELYLKTLLCIDKAASVEFFNIFDAEELALDGWNRAISYEEAYSIATERFPNKDEVCKSW